MTLRWNAGHRRGTNMPNDPKVVAEVAAVASNLKAADEVKGQQTTAVADDLKIANAEDRAELRKDNARKFWIALVLALPAVIAAMSGIVANINIQRVHHLVNSAMEYQLELVVESATKLANKDPSEANAEALHIAKGALEKHKRGEQ